MVIQDKARFLLSQTILNAFFIIMIIAILLPFWMIISISLSNDIDVAHFGYNIIPIKIDFSAYSYMFQDYGIILSSYKVTTITAFGGTIIYLIMASMCAFALARRDFIYRNKITFYLFFTMLFSGGLVPYYILMTKYMGLRNTYLALIIPMLGNVWNLFLMKTFFQQIPYSIIESAKIDGASEFRTYSTIVLPLSTPVLATVGLIQLLAGWNSWFPALLFISDHTLYPLQYLLQIMLRNIQEITNNMNNNLGMESVQELPTEGLRMAMCIVAIGPMLVIFPFFQKYFTKGLTVGAVKG